MKNQPCTFTISEFGQRARITVRTLRFYEELGLLVPAQQNSSGHRLYGLTELAKLQQIQALKFIGYSLQEIKDLLNDDDTKGLAQLEKSLPLQHKLLLEKIEELNRAIEAIEHVQRLIKEEKPITWTVLSSLIFQMEHEQEQLEWAKEFFSDDFLKEIFSLSKEQRQQIDMEMLDWLATVKKLVKDNVSPRSPEAFDVLAKLTELMTRHVEKEETLLEQLEKAQASMELDVIDFQFPHFFTSEEEAFLEEIAKSMEALHEENEE